MFQFKAFQREDVSRMAMHDGAIDATDTGGGKSLEGLTFANLKCGFSKRLSPPRDRVLVPEQFAITPGIYPDQPALLIAPEHLHLQWADELWDKFRSTFIKLDSQDTYLRLCAQSAIGNRQSAIPPGWYITSFTQLCSNKVAKIPDLAGVRDAAALQAIAAQFHVTAGDVAREPRSEWDDAQGCVVPLSPEQRLKRATQKKIDFYTQGVGESREYRGGTRVSRVVSGVAPETTELLTGLGSAERDAQHNPRDAGATHKITCCYSPSLAHLCKDAFACVVIDEATKIKSDHTLIGVGCRLMNPRYRLVMSGTPIKNRLPDLFWLAWWAAGGREEAHPRWPYTAEVESKEQFAEEFLVCERNLTKERADNNGRPLPDRMRGGRERRGKVTAEVCNVHRLWKLIAPVVLRRRKRDFGEDVVKKIRQPIRVPMGTHQARVYQYHLHAPYQDKNGKPAPGAKLQALRMAAVAPHSPNLEFQGGTGVPRGTSGFRRDAGADNRDGCPTKSDYFRSDFDFTPKVSAALNVIEQRIRAGKQCVVFSSFLEPLDTLGRRLAEAGIPHETMDGRNSPAVRGGKSREFKQGRPQGVPVLLACRPAVAEGNSWHRCQSGLHLDYDWALDLNVQSDDRYHRINSPEDVHSYRLMAAGSIDRKLESLFEEKDDSAELVLDGTLINETIEEVSMWKVLQIAEREFNAEDTIDEEELERSWPELKARLQDAWNSTRFIGLLNGGIRKLPAEALVLPVLGSGSTGVSPVVRCVPRRTPVLTQPQPRRNIFAFV